MTDSATSRYKARKQSQGSNNNTWGDDKLNDNLDLFDHGSKGVDSQAMTGDTTLSWANYDDSAEVNTGQCAVLLLTGSLTAVANLVVPSVEWSWDLIKNSTGQTVTVKTSGGTGVAIPNGRQVPVYCDGSDCYFGSPNYLGTDISEGNNRDLADKAYVDGAISTASLPATAGTSLVSGSDTTAGYLGQKLNLAVSGAISGAWSVENPAADENALLSLAVGQLGLTDGGLQTSGFTAAVNTRYVARFGAAGTITFPLSATTGDLIAITYAGYYNYTHDPNGLKINTSTSNYPLIGNQTYIWEYTGTTDGWV